MARGAGSGVRAVAAALVAAAIATTGVARVAAFDDVDDTAWYAPAVDWLHDAGLTTGTMPGCFEPDRALTRAEAGVFLHRLAGAPAPGGPPPFTDVTAPWQRAAVAWMAETGITTGVAPGRFAPGAPLTRGQFAAFLHRYAGRPAAPTHPFTDIGAPWQHEPVAWLWSTGITTGTGATRFDPDAFVTRAQLAAFLHRFEGSPPASAPAPAEPPCRRPIVIHGTGDVNFDPAYGPNPQHPFAHAWTGLAGLFAFDDLTIVNLECVPSDLGAPVPKRFTFRCPPAALAPARAAGVDVANLANNHGGDFGVPALLDAAANVAAAGIVPVGTGADLGEATTAALFERNGWTIAVLGFNTVGLNPEWHAGAGRAGMAPGDIPTLVAAVEAADRIADLVVVTIHWGIEATFTPAADDVPRARAMIEAGADVVFGHHPHRLQPLEFHQGRPIFWSLGNFVWQSVDRSKHTGVGQVTVHPDGSIEARILPAVIASKGRPVLTG